MLLLLFFLEKREESEILLGKTYLITGYLFPEEHMLLFDWFFKYSGKS